MLFSFDTFRGYLIIIRLFNIFINLKNKIMRKFYLLIIVGILLSSVTVYSQLSILLVNDNSVDGTEVNKLKTSLDNLGYTYTFHNANTQGAPSLSTMQAYSLVIWYTGKDGGGLYFWNGNNTPNQDIMDYIDGGGMFWLQGRDFIYDVYGAAPDTFSPGDFLYDYLGIETYAAQSYLDDGGAGVSQMDVVPGNNIFTFTPIEWTVSGLYYADALVPIAGADSVYRMGPTGYVFDNYFSAIYYEKGDGKVLSFAFDTYYVDTQTHLDTLFNQGLQYFEQFANSFVYVTDITVSGDGGATTIDVNKGSLQMYADVQPANASDPTVQWSVVGGTTNAKIDQNGLLKASGTHLGNGTVWVKAEAVDGSGVADSLEITISNQGSDFEVLLVNDNANGTTRYLELDTTLTNLDYAYDIYHTEETGTYPDILTLGYYDVVIWYTGNDGVDLKLWDLSDPNDYKFNEPLRLYMNGGGIVWLQGLDFMYDIFGSAPDTLQPGQFIYDYMGIKTYAAQSKADDGGVGVAQMDIEAGSPDPICTFTPIEWVYSTLWYADGFEITPNAEGVYRMGPPGYVLDAYLSGVYNVNGNSRVLTFGFETARIDTEVHTDTLFSQVLTYFEGVAGNDVFVTDVTVTSEGGATSIDVNKGTLQMYADVQPPNATNPIVYWEVIDVTGHAEIDQNGLLQAGGYSYGNGDVWVKATSTDGTSIADSMLITISNQGSDFEIMLVNDNNNGSTRYEVIDTALTHLGYTFMLYNTVTEGTYPSYDLMKYFDAVIWYTGNDSYNLKLWDLSNPNDYKFNVPLMQYLNNGGIVWLQGLDFMYDIYGGAPDSFIPGQFIYDYMGIQEYAAQSKVNDGGAGVPQFDLVPGNPLCTLDPLLWTYSTMWYADGFVITPTAQPVYKMGPAGSYMFDTLVSGVYNEFGQGKIFTLATETARLVSQDATDTLFHQVLESFRGIAGSTYSVNLKVNLEGPYNGTEMNTGLNENGLLPLKQPFSTAPWNYTGYDSVVAIPNSDVVDWVLVELRDAATAADANSSTTIARRPAFVLKDGSVVDMDGESVLRFTQPVSQHLFAVVWHKNHLGILSTNPLSGFNSAYSYDFTTSNTKAYGTDAQKDLGGGVYGMYGGDANGDGIINIDDGTQEWYPQAGTAGYLSSDVTLDGQSDNKDKNDIWVDNLTKQCQVPN